MSKSGDKIVEIPIFEQSTKEQKENKPPIEKVCEYFLEDKILKDGMARLLEISRELKMKPVWVSKNAYKCTYKGKSVVSYSFKNADNLTISVSIADRDDLERVILAQSDDLITEFLNRTTTHCGSCSASDCDFNVKIEVKGKKYHFCSRFNYMRHNPTAEQFNRIERFIDIRRNYIDSKSKSK